MQDKALSSPTNEVWSLLDAEFDAWSASGQVASLWWRDDDAALPGPKLERLVDMTLTTGLLLAVIPARANTSLGPALGYASHVQVAQHGYSHTNHAPRGQGLGAWELGMHRGEAAVLDELLAGRELLEQLFGSCFLPVVVPPWNRIATELFQPIAACGYRGISTFGPRTPLDTAPVLRMVNAHCDPIRWKEGARFRGIAKTVNQLIDHLQARRCGLVDADEPTGFLTHHIDLDEPAWEFCQELVNRVDRHPGASWVLPDDVFGETP